MSTHSTIWAARFPTMRKRPLVFAIAAVLVLAAVVTVATLAGFDMDWLGLDLPWLE